MKKLTLCADENVIRKARQLARKNKTSISAMFSRYVLALSRIQEKPPEEELGPRTRKMLGIAKLPPNKTDGILLEESRMEKYAPRKRRSVAEHPACGMWKDREDMNDALACLRRMQKPRHVI